MAIVRLAGCIPVRLGVTGRTGSGKSTLCRQLGDAAALAGIRYRVIDAEALLEEILNGTGFTRGYDVREELGRVAGVPIRKFNGAVDRQALATLKRADPAKWNGCWAIIRAGVRGRVEEFLRSKEPFDLTVVESANLEPDGLLELVQWNVVHVQCRPALIKKRLRSAKIARITPPGQFEEQRQDGDEQKAILAAIAQAGQGHYRKIDGSRLLDGASVMSMLNSVLTKRAYAA